MSFSKRPFILASQSPRRRSLLKKAGYRFRVVPSNASERHPARMSPSARVRYLALKKARVVAKKNPASLIMGSDTLVFINGHAVGKPRNARHAARMLAELSGKWQIVISAVALVWDGGRKSMVGHEVSRVKLRSLTPADIKKTVRHHMDKAGGYAVQQKKDPFVERFEGDYTNIVGLPMRLVRKMIRSVSGRISRPASSFETRRRRAQI